MSQPDTQRTTPRRRGSSSWVERNLLRILGGTTIGLLLLVFYYPVATVFIEAIRIDSVITLRVFTDILRDPFYFGDAARILNGESPRAVLTKFLSPDRQLGIIGFTTYQAILSTIASVALGVPAAYILARFEFYGRRTLRSLTILPFVLPSIMVAVGFVATFGRNGTLNQFLGWLNVGSINLMFTLEAIVIAHAFYNAPLVARVTTVAWETVDASAVETARSLGASPLQAFRDVIAPQLYPAILMGATLAFVFTFGTFPIVLALGGFRYVTVEVFVYRLVRDLQYAEAAALAIIELVISLGFLYGYLRYEAAQSVRARQVRPLPRRPLRPRVWTWSAGLLRGVIGAYAVIALVVFVAPIASMILASLTGPQGITFDHYRFLIDRQLTGAEFQVRPWISIRNSLLFGIGALLLAIPIGIVISILTTREYRGRKFVDVIAMAPLAVSGIIVGLGLLRGLVFGVEILEYHFVIGGAIAIVAAHAVVGYPFVVRTLVPGLESLDYRIIESARSLGASRARAILDIELPIVWPGIVAGASFVFALSIGEFSATVILATGTDQYTMPVAIERFIGRRIGPATAMGVVLLIVTSVSFYVIDRLGGDHLGL